MLFRSLPLILPLLLPGMSVNPMKIAQSLCLLMLLPLGVALTVRARAPKAAAGLRALLNPVSNLSLFLLVVLLVIVNFKSVLGVFGTGGIVAGVLLVGVGYGAGWLLGGPGADTRLVLGLGTSQRNIAAALVVGSQSFSDPNVVVIVVVTAIVSLLILMPLSRFLARGTPRGEK